MISSILQYILTAPFYFYVLSQIINLSVIEIICLYFSVYFKDIYDLVTLANEARFMFGATMYFTLHNNPWKLEKHSQVCYCSVFCVNFNLPTQNCQTQLKMKCTQISSLSFWLQTGPDPALHHGCFSNPEDISHGGGQTVVPHYPTGHHHHSGLHQGHTGAPQIQTGQHLIQL